MSETATPATELTSQYITKVTADLEHNVKEQGRISEEIASLQEQLVALQHDHTVLVTMQQALGITEGRTGLTTQPESLAVPAPRQTASAASKRKQKPRKATALTEDVVGKKRPAPKASGGAKAARPTLVELIRRCLTEQHEPLSAAEVSSMLGQAHPERNISTKVVRITLEGLVAKSQAERTKQGKSVFYTAPSPESTKTVPVAAE